MRLIKICGQILFLVIFSIMMDGLTKWLGLEIPGSVLGIVLLFLLLKTGIIRLKWVEGGASFLLAELLLFFIPSAVGVVKYKQLLATEGLRILLIVILGTIIVMGATGMISKIISEHKGRSVREH